MRRFAFGALAAMLTAAAPALAQQQYSIATGGTGGVYYPLGGGMANVLTQSLPGFAFTAEVTGGSVDNLKLVGSGKPYFALTMADAALDAREGHDKFKGHKVAVATLAVLYPNTMHVVTTESTGIAKMADLKGKRVSTGSPGSATEVMAFRVLEAAGLDKDKDIERERLGAAESVNAMKDGKIAAFFWVGGIPTSAVTDLGATPGVKLKILDIADLADKMNKKYGNLYAKGVIKAHAYPGLEKDVQIVDVWNLLVANEGMPEKVAYDIVKTIFEKQPSLVAVHKAANDIKLENQTNDRSPLPWHPGAAKYYAEKGIKLK
jgi:TRAP transporter TAXI family solute receptor